MEANISPNVSVIMAVYNGASYLDESIKSVLEQTLSNFQFIIVNDGSTDTSADIIKKYSETDNRIYIIEQENRGLTYSLNKAIKQAKGKYIARQDADDISLPNRLQEQYDLLESDNNIGVCATNFWIAGEDGVPVYSYPRNLSSEEIKNRISCGDNIFTHGTVMLRKDILNDMDPVYRFRYAQDFDLWLRLLNKTIFFIISEPLYIYRRQQGSISTSVKGQRNATTDLMVRLYEERKKDSEKELSDWKVEEQWIFDNVNPVSRSKTSYVKGYLQLLKGHQFLAFKELLCSGNCITCYILILISLLPLGYKLARLLHKYQNKQREVIWYS